MATIRSSMENEFETKNILCLSCCEILPRTGQNIVACPRCGASINTKDSDDIFRYAAEVYHYGYQYRVYYEHAFQLSTSPAKPSLVFAGEAFVWVMSAMLSGVIGSATYDLIKAVVIDIRAQSRARCAEDKSYEALLSVTDKELEEMFLYARDYYQGLELIRKEVRAAIIEEIVADEVSHDPVICNELMKLMGRETIKPKHRRKAADLYRVAITRAVNRKPPVKERFFGLWSARSSNHKR